MNPYFISDTAQLCFSGGRTSAYLTRQVQLAHGGTLPDYVHTCFQNTGKEVEETLAFIQECSERWDIPVTWMEWCREWGQPEDKPWFRIVDFKKASRKGEPFEMMVEYYANYRREVKQLDPVLPNFSNNMCTAYLKTKIGEKYMRSLGYDEWDCIVGIRYDEPNRYHRMMAANARGNGRWDNYVPLYLAGITKDHVMEFWSEQPFDLGIDSDLGNCDLCWKKSPAKIHRAIAIDPSRVIWWSGMEEKYGQPFRRDRADYKTMAWTSEQMARQESFDFDMEFDATDIDCFCGD